MNDRDISGEEAPRLSVSEAFDAARLFLEAYWERGARSSDDIAVLLGSMNREATRDGGPIDAAQWVDWIEAVRRVQAKSDPTSP